MKLNNKGFAITGFLYSIFAIFLVILSMLIISMTSSKLTLDKVKKNVKTSLDDIESSDGYYEKAFSYTGGEQSFTVPYTGWYQIELWGAEGGATTASLSGNGSYVSGKTYLTKSETVYFYVGGKGGSEAAITNVGGYNGGGYSGNNAGAQSFGGGGATDVRLTNGAWNNSTSLASRIMIAGGGAGTSTGTTTVSGAGGTLLGEMGTSSNSTYNTSTYLPLGGTQISGGFGYNGRDGSFGYAIQSNTSGWGGGGGGGYYGGGNGHGTTGAGGSSFISGYAGVNAITSSTSLTPTNSTIHYSNKYFINGVMQSGINSGNGKAKITYLSDVKPIIKNSNLNNVRYIKDCINGNTINNDDHWVELQATYNGNNIAKGKTITGTVTSNPSYPYTKITDGDITSANFSVASTTGLQCITVDLGQSYNLDEIAVWHYYADSRTYNSNTTYVSSDNYNWTIIKNTKEVETANGKRISAYEYSDVDTTTNNIIYQNLVTNGSFENGMNNWTAGAGISSVANSSKYGSYLAFNYHAVQYTNAEQIVNAVANHKYYASSWMYSNSGSNGYCYSTMSFIYDFSDHWQGYIGGQQTNFQVWENKSQIYTASSSASQTIRYVVAAFNGTDSLSNCYADGALLVDLTATFGAGNEPTKEWCDANLAYVDTSGYTKIYQN